MLEFDGLILNFVLIGFSGGKPAMMDDGMAEELFEVELRSC